MSGFLEHEKETNKFLNSILNDFSKKKFFEGNLDKNLVIFSPHGASIQKLKKPIPDEFFQCHIAIINDGKFQSLSGLNGTISEKILSTENKQTIHVMRKDEIQFYTTTIPLFIISSPIFYPMCLWWGLAEKELRKQLIVVKKKKKKPKASVVERRKRDIRKSKSVETLNRRRRAMSQKESTKDKKIGLGSSIFQFFQFQKKEEKKKRSIPNSIKNKHFEKVFSYKDFTRKLRESEDFESKRIVKCIKLFITNIKNQGYREQITKAKVNNFITETILKILKLPNWAASRQNEEELNVIMESMEKYLMSKLHEQLFSPTMELINKDNQIARKLQHLKVGIKPENMGLHPKLAGENGKEKNRNWLRAKRELRRINNYHSPRDKLICISNSQKFLFNVLNDLKEGTNSFGTDDLLPAFLFLVLSSNPAHLQSNLQYIMEFRNPDKLEEADAGWCLTLLQSAISFWEQANHTNFIGINKEEFEDLLKTLKSSMSTRSLVDDSISDTTSVKSDTTSIKSFGEDLEENLLKSKKKPNWTENIQNIQSQPKIVIDEPEAKEKEVNEKEPNNKEEKRTLDYKEELHQIVNKIRPKISNDFDESDFENMNITKLRMIFEEYKILRKFFEETSKMVNVNKK